MLSSPESGGGHGGGEQRWAGGEAKVGVERTARLGGAWRGAAQKS